MQSFKALFSLFVLSAVWAQTATAQPRFGAQDVKGEPNRVQQWLVPSPDSDTAAHAVLFRPVGDGPFRLAVIAHASTENVLRRAQMPQPEYRALAAWLVARGFAVLVPNAQAMAQPADAILRTRAVAMRQIIHALGAPLPTKSRPR